MSVVRNYAHFIARMLVFQKDRSLTSGPFTLIKFAPDSLAMAFASSVFPHPGGP